MNRVSMNPAWPISGGYPGKLHRQLWNFRGVSTKFREISSISRSSSIFGGDFQEFQTPRCNTGVKPTVLLLLQCIYPAGQCLTVGLHRCHVLCERWLGLSINTHTRAHWQNLKADWIYSTKWMMMQSCGWNLQRLQHSWNNNIRTQG